MAIDWEAVCGAPNVAIFGEPATYVPATVGAASFPVTGVFDNEFRKTVIIDDNAPTTDLLPVFGVNAGQFAPTDADPDRALPTQNDKIVFPAGSQPHSGKTYFVVEPRPDNHGIFHLALNEAAVDG